MAKKVTLSWLAEPFTLPEARLLNTVSALMQKGLTVEATAALTGLYLRAQSVRSKGGGAKSKAKGRAFMVKVAALITNALQLEEGDVFVKATSQIGCDLHMSPRAARVFPFSVEGKMVETLNIWAALLQAGGNADPHRPAIVFFSRAHAPTYVALDAEVFLELVRRSQRDAETGADGAR